MIKILVAGSHRSRSPYHFTAQYGQEEKEEEENSFAISSSSLIFHTLSESHCVCVIVCVFTFQKCCSNGDRWRPHKKERKIKVAQLKLIKIDQD